ncbi:MAG TPA: hypothetical protein VGG14_00970 [Candidatus Sulfotelmatobacter sp.]|jgi:hypothetical protein
MEHPCYKCGHIVEDGRPFCVQCGAPQIRVILPEPVTPMAGCVQGSPVFSSESAEPLNPAVLSPVIVWPVAIRACAIAALIAALFMAFGLIVPLLAVLGAGFLAVSLYHRKNPAWLVNARSGAKLGAACGILFFGFATVIETIAVAVFHTGGEVRKKMLEALQQAATRSNDPQVQAAFEKLKTPEGIALMLVFGMIFLLLLSIAAGGLSGALTGAFFGRRKRP